MSKPRNLPVLFVLGALLNACAMDPPPEFDASDSFDDSVGYRIEIDRFFDGDASNNAPVAMVEYATNYQGGDLKGILEKIEAGYFSELGVSLLILSSPVDGPEGKALRSDGHYSSGYHGQWPVSVDQMEGRFGTEEQLASLVAAAHEQGIRVIMEYEANHVHSDSPVYQNHVDWFWPLQLLGSDISWDAPDAQKGWVAPYVPDFHFSDVGAARSACAEWAASWAKNLDLDGFLLHHAQLIDSRWLPGLFTALSGELSSDKAGDFRLLGNVFSNSAEVLNSYIGESSLDGQTDYPLRAAIIETILLRSYPLADLGTFLADNQDRYSGVMLNTLGSTLHPRAIHYAVDTPHWNNPWDSGESLSWNGQPDLPAEDAAFQRMKAAFSVVFSLKGIPLILYGDEIGLPGAGDPDNRRFMTWGSLSSGQAALKAHVAKLASVRAAHPALRRGDLTILDSSPETLVFRRRTSGDTVYVVINRDDTEHEAGGLPAQTLTDAVDNGVFSGPTVTVPPRSVLILLP